MRRRVSLPKQERRRQPCCSSNQKLRYHLGTLRPKCTGPGQVGPGAPSPSAWLTPGDVELRQRASEVALMKELGLFIDMLPDGNYPGAVPPEEMPQEAEA